MAKADIIKHFEDAKALIADPDKHCKYKLYSGDRMCSYAALFTAMNPGQKVGTYSEGGAKNIGEYEGSPEYKLLEGAAKEAGFSNICGLNNGLQHEDLMSFWDKAIEKAKALPE